MMEPKIDKNTRLLREMDKFLPRLALIIIYKAFPRSYFDYYDILYDKASNAYFHQNLYHTILAWLCLKLLEISLK